MHHTRVTAGLVLPAFLGLAVIAVLSAMLLSASRHASAPDGPVDASGPPVDRIGEGASLPPSGPSSPARRARALGVDEAVRELELIRPARPKLADDFTIPLAGGQTFKLSAQRGRAVMINFWATWCAPCREEMPAMERLWREHKDGRLAIVAVSVDADPKVLPPFLGQHRYTFPVGLDPKMALAHAYGVRAIPSSFLVDRSGTLVALALGPRRWDNDASRALIAAMIERDIR